MGAKEFTIKTDDGIEKYKIHNFIRKMFQKDVFDKLVEYIDWRIKRNKRLNVNYPLMSPVSINLDLTTACTYLCDHCVDAIVTRNKPSSLKIDNIKKLISRWVNECLKSAIVIGGGEPLLHPDFEEVIAFLKSKKLELSIVSNGSLVARIENIAYLLDARDWIRLSLDAGTDETFQKIHNPKERITLDQILWEVKKLTEKFSDFQLGFSYLILSDDHFVNNKKLVNNVREIPLAVKKAKESGFSYFSIKPFILPLKPRPTEYQKRFIEEIKENLMLAKEFEDEHFKVIESFNLLALLHNFNEKLRIQTKICHAQFFRLVVAPSGILNCTLWRGFNINRLINVQQEINEQFFKKLQEKLSESIENFDASKECNRVSCIYNDFNWFIEDMINNPEKLQYLKKTDNFYDYFL